MAMRRAPPAARSIAPPMPPPVWPGMLQFARSPFAATWNAPRTTVVTRPVRAIANDVVESKYDVPGTGVTSCPLAL